MSFEITIRANDPSEFAQQVVSLAFMLAPNLQERLNAEPKAQPEPEKKGRGRPKKESKDDVRPESGRSADGNGDGAVSTADVEHTDGPANDGGAGSTAGDGAPSGRGAEAAEAQEAEAPVEPAKSEAPSEEQAISIDELRKYTIDNYLNGCFDKLDDRKVAYEALLKEFDISNIQSLPADKAGAFKASVDAKIEAAAKGKK